MAGGHAHPVAGCGQAPDYMTTDKTGAAKNAYRVSFHAAQVLGRARGALFVAGSIVAGARAAVKPRARRIVYAGAPRRARPSQHGRMFDRTAHCKEQS